LNETEERYIYCKGSLNDSSEVSKNKKNDNVSKGDVFQAMVWNGSILGDDCDDIDSIDIVVERMHDVSRTDGGEPRDHCGRRWRIPHLSLWT